LANQKMIRIFKYKKLIKEKKMKKVFLALAIMAALTTISCKQSEPTAATVLDSVAVQVDSVQVDTVQVDTVKTDSVKK